MKDLTKIKSVLFLTLILICNLGLEAKVRMPGLFTNNMVLERDVPVNIWGWADKNEKIEVLFNGQHQETKANAKGEWSVTLKPAPYGGPYVLTIKGKDNSIDLENVMLGEVWVCSGQSNMEWGVRSTNNAEEEIKNANYPNIRLFTVPKISRGISQEDVEGEWTECTPETVANFSAVGYFFGRKLYQELDIPIGLINASWSGTRIEAWMSPEAYMALPDSCRHYFIDYNRDVKYPSKEIDDLYKNNLIAVKKFQEVLAENNDPALDEKWYDNDYDYSSWEVLEYPNQWYNIPKMVTIDGCLWLKQEIELPQGVENEFGRIDLGNVDDDDILWVNGVKIGHTKGAGTRSIYTTPYGLLRPGKNIITVCNIDKAGNGGIAPSTEMSLDIAGTKYSLNGDWKAKMSLSSKDFYDRALTPNHYASTIYMGLINPLTKYTIKGVIWYQGESNESFPHIYQVLFPTMIKDWRNKWGYEFPFYWVQLANYKTTGDEPRDTDWARLRDAQTQTLSLPKTSQVSIIDIGDPNDIHPRNKQDVGFRLALTALNKDYGMTDLEYSGPTYKSMNKEGNKIIITFDHAQSGFISKDKNGYFRGFSIAGADKKFVWAKAFPIGNNKIEVYSDSITDPVAIRYNWDDNPDGTIFNGKGLPMAPFRTDNWNREK